MQQSRLLFVAMLRGTTTLRPLAGRAIVRRQHTQRLHSAWGSVSGSEERQRRRDVANDPRRPQPQLGRRSDEWKRRDVAKPRHEVAKQRHDVAKPRFDASKPRHDVAKQRYDAAKPRLDAAKPRHDVAKPRQPRHWDEYPSSAEFVYGIAPVMAALRSRRRDAIYALYHETELSNEMRRLCGELDIQVVEQPKGRLQEAIGQAKAVHQGVALCCSPLRLELLDAAFDAPLWLALDEVQDPRNLGAIVRSARFFDCPVVSCAKNSAPLSPVASKASAGAVEEFQIYEARNLVAFLKNSKPHFKVVGAAIHPGKRKQRAVTNLRDFKLDQPTILVLGSEGTGLRTNILDACDDLLKVQGRLPLDAESGVDSLNVAVTAALLLHHLDLQIERLGGHRPMS